MKRFLILISVVILAIGSAPSQAEPDPAVAIIDVGFNTSLFSKNVVYEVCIISNSLCPNGKRFQEGPGASNVGASALPTFLHGTTMLSVLTTVYPEAKVVTIRIVGLNMNGRAGAYTIDDVNTALGWVVANHKRLNIKAVSISQGRVNGNCRVIPDFVAKVKTLKAEDVAVIASSGNERNRSNMAVPACIDDVISVGATDNPHPGVQALAWDPSAIPAIAHYSNGNISTDFYTNGRFFHFSQDGSRQFSVGTSNATAAFAGWWMKNLKPSWTQTYDFLVEQSTTASNNWLKGRYVSIP